MPPDEVHFHEVGAVDSIVDIVGACIALELLDKPRVSASNVIEGTGWVQCAHGRFPVPTMATLSILGERGIPLTQCEEPHELVTPTGAAILAQFVDSFGPMNQLVATQIGYGLGTRDNQTRPNVLRAVLGDAPANPTVDWETDTIGVIECNLDDLSPEILGHTMGLALEAGALDVFHTPIQMKKQRPGTLFTILCRVEEITQFSKLVLLETSAFGVRTFESKRYKLNRTESIVNTTYGPIAVKIGYLDGKAIRVTPEYDSCRELAQKHRVPLQEIMGAFATAQHSLQGDSQESGTDSDST